MATRHSIPPPLDIAQVLRPVAPPLVVGDVYTDDQYERMVKVIKGNGPWQSIIAQHFDTVDEVIATTTGTISEGHGMTLDDIATAQFRGFFAQNSVCLYPGLEDAFYNPRFLAAATQYWGAQFAKPTLMLFNLCGPHESIPVPHLDAVTFRGARIENTPPWIQNLMGKSGLFTDYLVKMAQVIAWWYRGEFGSFTYWPDGPHEPPRTLPSPMWNLGVVVQNEMMFHRGDPVGRPEERPIEGLRNRSMLRYRPGLGDWAITTDDEVVRTYRPEEMRLLVHWNAEVYTDRAELERRMDGSQDLTPDLIVDTFLADLARRGVPVTEPTDPYRDPAFIAALANTYSIAPTIDWI